MHVKGVSPAVAIAVLVIVAIMFGLGVYLLSRTYTSTTEDLVAVSVYKQVSHVSDKTLVSATIRVAALTENTVTVERICLFGVTSKGVIVPLTPDCAPAYQNPCWASTSYGVSPPIEVQPSIPIEVKAIVTYNPSCSPITAGTDLVSVGAVVFYSTPEGHSGIAVSGLS